MKIISSRKNFNNNLFFASFILISLFIVGLYFKEGFDFKVTAKGSSVAINGYRIAVELADTMEKQVKGLSNVPKLEDSTGMLFIFSGSQVRHFWMKDMAFPLDIIWIEAGKVVKVDHDLPPEGSVPEKSYSSILPVDQVLEINAGDADKLNIKVGDKLEYNL